MVKYREIIYVIMLKYSIVYMYLLAHISRISGNSQTWSYDLSRRRDLKVYSKLLV